MSKKRLSKSKLMQMRNDYFNYMSMNAIAEKYEVSRSTVKHHVDSQWKAEREMRKAELYQQLSDSKQVEFTDITNSTIKVLKRSLQYLAERTEPPTLREAVDASKILDILDKITRLDESKPTEIIGNQERPLTIESVKQKLALDPFQSEEVVPVIEVKESEKDSGTD